jgi:MarR family transcriptional regulator, organic hydroperoxide resistance regulator
VIDRQPEKTFTLSERVRSGSATCGSPRQHMVKHPPDRSFGHMVREVNGLCQRMLRKRLKRHGVSSAQWYILRVLWIQDGLTLTEIAQRAGVAPPQIVSGLRGLIKQGRVVRDKHPSDQRKNVVFLTKRGRQLENPCFEEAIIANEVALANVSVKDVQTIMRLLHQVRSNLNDDEVVNRNRKLRASKS